MPDLTRLSEGRNADALAHALAAENVAYLDLFAAFEGQEEVLYFAQDPTGTTGERLWPPTP